MNDNDEAKNSKAEELTDTVLNAAAMEETEDYLARGRRFQRLTNKELGERWTNGIKAWRLERSKNWQLEFDDAAAELRLRGAEPPWDTVQDEVALALAAARRDLSEHPDEAKEALETRIAELLSKQGRSSH